MAQLYVHIIPRSSAIAQLPPKPNRSSVSSWATTNNLGIKKKSIIKVKDSVLLYDSLTSIRFELKGKVYEIDVGGELLIDGEDIHSQVERIPAVLGYFGSIVTILTEEHKNKEVLLKKIEARIDKKIREAGVIGEARIDKAIKRHPKWTEACFEVNKARSKASKARYLYVSLKEKAMTLSSRSADMRSSPSDSIRGVKREEIIRFDEDED